MLPERLARIKDILCCPSCKGTLSFGDSVASCGTCEMAYAIENGKIRFVDVSPSDDDLDSIKTFLKIRMGRLYHGFLVPFLAPAYPFNLARYIDRHAMPMPAVMVDLGSGNKRFHANAITVDLRDYEHVDIVCDAGALPFRVGTVDLVTTDNVLEHVPDYPRVIAEIESVVKPGGHAIHIIPFMYPFHASPDDYQRFTHNGAAHLSPDWSIVEQIPTSGPFVLFVAALAEFVSIVLGFGNARIRSLVYLGACVLLAPIKYLDVLFVRRRAFLTLAPAILTHLRKPSDAAIDGLTDGTDGQRPHTE